MIKKTIFVDCGLLKPNIREGDIIPVGNDIFQVYMIVSKPVGHQSKHPDGVKDNLFEWSFKMKSLEFSESEYGS